MAVAGVRQQQATVFSIPDHSQSHPVLYRTAGIQKLQLCQEPGGQRIFFFYFFHMQNRSVTHQLLRGGIDVFHNKTSLRLLRFEFSQFAFEKIIPQGKGRVNHCIDRTQRSMI